MPHTYRWADPEHTIIERDDGARIVLPPGENIANINCGRLAEEFRLDSCLTKITEYEPPAPVAAPKRLVDDQDRARRRAAAAEVPRRLR